MGKRCITVVRRLELLQDLKNNDRENRAMVIAKLFQRLTLPALES